MTREERNATRDQLVREAVEAGDVSAMLPPYKAVHETYRLDPFAAAHLLADALASIGRLPLGRAAESVAEEWLAKELPVDEIIERAWKAAGPDRRKELPL